MKFGDQERLLRLIPNRETQMEIDAETRRQIEAEWMKGKDGGDGGMEESEE